MVKTASMAAGALVVSKRWQEESLEWKRYSYSEKYSPQKTPRPTIWLTLPAILRFDQSGQGIICA